MVALRFSERTLQIPSCGTLQRRVLPEGPDVASRYVRTRMFLCVGDFFMRLLHHLWVIIQNMELANVNDIDIIIGETVYGTTTHCGATYLGGKSTVHTLASTHNGAIPLPWKDDTSYSNFIKSRNPIDSFVRPQSDTYEMENQDESAIQMDSACQHHNEFCGQSSAHPNTEKRPSSDTPNPTSKVCMPTQQHRQKRKQKQKQKRKQKQRQKRKRKQHHKSEQMTPPDPEPRLSICETDPSSPSTYIASATSSSFFAMSTAGKEKKKKPLVEPPVETHPRPAGAPPISLLPPAVKNFIALAGDDEVQVVQHGASVLQGNADKVASFTEVTGTGKTIQVITAGFDLMTSSSEKKLEDILNALAEENPPKQMLAILASILNSGLTCSFKSKEQLLTTVWTDSTFESDRILIDRTDQTDQTDQSDSDCREQLGVQIPAMAKVAGDYVLKWLTFHVPGLPEAIQKLLDFSSNLEQYINGQKSLLPGV